jgi:hypothetical protein
MVAPLAQSRLMILADENEGGEKNRFQGDNQRKKSEGKWIEMCDSGNDINDDPASKPDQMRPYKGHAATEIRDRVSNIVGSGPIGFCSLVQLYDRLDIALRQIFDGVRPVIVVVIGFRAFGGWIHGYDGFVFLLMCSSVNNNSTFSLIPRQ